MQSEILVMIILSAVAALAIVLYQYYYKSKRRGSVYGILSFLRFLAVFGIFLLLINPKFTKDEYTLEKTNLVVLLDNSSSLRTTNATKHITEISKVLLGSKEITDKFNVNSYSFGIELNTTDSLSFTEKATNITKTLSTVNDIYAKTSTAVILITDGNQTLGEDYEFYGKKQKFPIYPIAIGDTTRYADIRIDQVNINKYAFLKNKYPIEVYVTYQGVGNASSLLTISVDGNNVYKERITLTNTLNTKISNTLLDAKSVGVKNIKVTLSPLKNERNIANNERNSVVEVIDEKTNIVIISELLHPDIGALKKSIESNEQRSVSIRKPYVPLTELDEVDLFILYQPNTSFNTIYKYIQQKGVSTFTITGTKTDWNFLNRIQNSFEKNNYDQSEEVTPVLNSGFTRFDVSDFSSDGFPPLESNLGDILIPKISETLLGQRIKGIDLNEPLFILIGDKSEKEAVLFGENIWKWRAQSYRNNQNFKNFDDFIGKIILYLSTNIPKSRLSLGYENTYQGNSQAKITATYFDETFVFDGNATIILSVKGKENNIAKEIPMLLKNGYYETDLSSVPVGQYNFTATVKNENLVKSGSFVMLDFDIEQQFLSSDYQKLERLAQNTIGALYFPSETKKLIEDLVEEKQFLPTQKSRQNVVSLIDFKFLLGIIVMALAAEWFIRKYNGLT